MNSIQSTALRLIKHYSGILISEGFTASEPEQKQYCYEISVSKTKSKIKLQIYFGSKGNKTIIQGDKKSVIYDEVSALINGEKLFQLHERFIEPLNYIGTDESGKGDYFGPLCIAGVITNPEITLKLIKAGVKDSKLLSDIAIDNITVTIIGILKDNFSVITITPSTYNSLHEKMGNVNRILGWAHARVIENLLEKKEIPEAISDKFGDESYIIRNLREKGKGIKLHQFTKAERYTGVAAASILARSSFNKWFREQKENGLDLPKGASSIVDKKVRELREKFDIAYLSGIAKIHFKTTNK